MEKKIISNEEDFLDYLKKGLKDVNELEVVEISHSMLTLNLKIKGDDYNSSITPPVMRLSLTYRKRYIAFIEIFQEKANYQIVKNWT